MENRNRRPNRRKNDVLMNYIMLGLVGLLLIFLVFYIIKTVASFGNKVSIKPESKNETLNESIRETRDESIKETGRETSLETIDESMKETVKETVEETIKETTIETSEETIRETETRREVKMPTPDRSRRANDKNAAIYTASQIKDLPQDILVDMIIKGDLGYGAERKKILEDAGFNYKKINEAVNKKLKEMR